MSRDPKADRRAKRRRRERYEQWEAITKLWVHQGVVVHHWDGTPVGTWPSFLGWRTKRPRAW